jgi:hypothetical protein
MAMLATFVILPFVIVMFTLALALVAIAAAVVRRKVAVSLVVLGLVITGALIGMAAFFVASPGRTAGLWARTWTWINDEPPDGSPHRFFDSEFEHRARTEVGRAQAEARQESAEALRAAREEARRLSRRPMEPAPPPPPPDVVPSDDLRPDHMGTHDVGEDHVPPGRGNPFAEVLALTSEDDAEPEDGYIDDGPFAFHMDHDTGPSFFAPVESLWAGRHGKPARALAFSLLSALAIGGFLGLGYVAFDSMTRGHFTWQLRILGVVAFLAMWLAASALRHW